MSDEELKVQDAIVNGLIGHYEAVIEQYKAEIEQLKSIPVKEQEPKTGHWIEIDMDVYKCSECSAEIVYDKSHYCPNCGAKMESE